jgi:long-chain fatty acid transport protein
MRTIEGILVPALACGALLATPAHATDGYFAHGYGIIGKGMGGASTALANDTFGGATNPAKMVFVGDRLDAGLELFSPRRNAGRSGSAVGIDGAADSDSNYFPIPEFGYNRMLGPNLALGITVYGNGGMNTDYPGGQIPSGSACGPATGPGTGFNPAPGPYNLLCGNGPLGVDLMQLIIAPTLSYRLSPDHAIGIAPLLGYQRFRIEGAQAFAGFSTAPNNVSNRGYDSATGVGVRIGWFGRLSDALTAGAAYSTRIRMSRFDDYRGLFAEQGDFDMPVNYNVGLAARIGPRTTLAIDYQRINYSDVPSVGNPSALLLECAGGSAANCLGGSRGAGFGWKDVNVWKLGLEYRRTDRLTLRGGYNRTDNPIDPADVTINILAPGVVQDHLTLGFTYRTAGGGEWSVAYMHAFENSVTGPSFFNNFTAPASAGTETIGMYQNALGVAYGVKL